MTHAVTSLADDDVHVWQAPLDRAGDLPALFATLADDERARAARFHAERDREHFIAGRGLLRAILARYVGVPAAELSFAYGPHGKPMLSAGSNAGDLRFNLAHSHGMALYALARGREVGVDLEYIAPRGEEGIAERFFSAAEVATLRRLPATERRDAFYACWTRKEAYIKARGDGLALDLSRFDVSLAPGEPAALLRHDDEVPARWSLAALDVAPGYAAALCVEGPLPPPICRRWS